VTKYGLCTLVNSLYRVFVYSMPKLYTSQFWAIARWGVELESETVKLYIM